MFVHCVVVAGSLLLNLWQTHILVTEDHHHCYHHYNHGLRDLPSQKFLTLLAETLQVGKLTYIFMLEN